MSEFLTDIEESVENNKRLEAEATNLLTNLNTLISNAEGVLDGVETKAAGKALKRTVGGLADGIGDVARELGKQDLGSKREFARACLEDMKAGAAAEGQVTSYQQSFANITEDDMVENLNTASTVLLDVEGALNSISDDEAEELAEVSITVAQIFLVMFKSLVGSINPQDLVGDDNDDGDVDFEELDGEGKALSSSEERRCARSRQMMMKKNRIRLIWPALGPKVMAAGRWTKNDALVKRPILTIAVGMAAMPSLVLGAFFAMPILTADYALQRGYEACDGEVLDKAEVGFANVAEVGKLYWLTGKIVAKQGLRVGRRQLDRRGGVGGVVKSVASSVVSCAADPVGTTKVIIGGVGDVVSGVVNGVQLAGEVFRGDASVNLKPTL